MPATGLVKLSSGQTLVTAALEPVTDASKTSPNFDIFLVASITQAKKNPAHGRGGSALTRPAQGGNAGDAKHLTRLWRLSN